MKKRKYILKCIVSVIMIGMLVCGCGKEEATVTEESNTEMIEEPVSETSVEEEEAIPEEQVADDAETQESVESTEMVDWETFAAQEENEEICIAIQNEMTAHQEVVIAENVEEAYTYKVQNGDRISIPIREKIYRIVYFSIKGEILSENKEIYSRNNTTEMLPYIEFQMVKGENYTIDIQTDDGHYFFCIENIGSN